MRGGGPVRVGLENLVIAMAITAARRIDQSGAQQRPAVFAGQVAIHQLRRIIVAGTAVLDLVDRRHGGRQFFDEMNLVRGTVAVAASGFAAVHAALDRTLHLAVTLVAAHLVRQRLEIVVLMLRGDIGMAVCTRNVRVRGRGEQDVVVRVAVAAAGVFRGDSPEKYRRSEKPAPASSEADGRESHRESSF